MTRARLALLSLLVLAGCCSQCRDRCPPPKRVVVLPAGSVVVGPDGTERTLTAPERFNLAETP